MRSNCSQVPMAVRLAMRAGRRRGRVPGRCPAVAAGFGGCAGTGPTCVGPLGDRRSRRQYSQGLAREGVSGSPRKQPTMVLPRAVPRIGGSPPTIDQTADHGRKLRRERPSRSSGSVHRTCCESTTSSGPTPGAGEALGVPVEASGVNGHDIVVSAGGCGSCRDAGSRSVSTGFRRRRRHWLRLRPEGVRPLGGQRRGRRLLVARAVGLASSARTG